MKHIRFLFIAAIPVLCLFLNQAQAEEEKKEEGKKEAKKPEPRSVGAEEIMKARNGRVKFYLIDSRTQKEYEAGHISGAVNLPLNDLGPASMEKTVPDKKARIVFYCENEECPSALASATKAMELGYEKVYKYRTGYSDWKNRGYAVDP